MTGVAAIPLASFSNTVHRLACVLLRTSMSAAQPYVPSLDNLTGNAILVIDWTCQRSVQTHLSESKALHIVSFASCTAAQQLVRHLELHFG